MRERDRIISRYSTGELPARRIGNTITHGQHMPNSLAAYLPIRGSAGT